MARIALGRPLCLLLMLAALTSQAAAADSVLRTSFNALGGNRKLLQTGSSGEFQLNGAHSAHAEGLVPALIARLSLCL